MARKQKKLAKGIYLCDGRVFFRVMVDGKRQMRKANLQGAQALDARERPTKELRREYANWVLSRQNEAAEGASQEKKVPTCRQLAEMYEVAARQEQLKNGGTPQDRTIQNALKHFRYAVEGCGIGWERPYTDMTSEELENYFVQLIGKGKERVSAWTYVSGVQSVTASWALRYYEREGYCVEKIKIPAIKNHKPGRYQRLKDETREAVKKWYAGLWDLEDKRYWLAATMMFQFAMRNGDVVAAEGTCFVRRGEQMYLAYTPHKTASSSGRNVMWPIHGDVWAKIEEARKSIASEDGKLVPAGAWTFTRLNRMLREKVKEFEGIEKAAYELRKMRIDAEYRKFGAERASALSGDDIRTLSYYYADVADMAPEAVRAEDLI